MDDKSSPGARSTESPSQGGQASLQPTYTTAGTVFNPQTTTPLQPPTRRGRAMRWPTNIPADLSAFNNSITGNFSRGRYRSPPTTASTLKHYSPLQQNSDRAADPLTSTVALKRSNSESPSVNMPLSPWNPLPCDLLTENSDDVQTVEDVFTLQDDECDTVLSKEQEEEEELLSRMGSYSVKTLTSLASYPNPYQKVAQLALDRARNTFKAANLDDSSRSISPSLSRHGLDGASAPPGLSRDNSELFSRVPRNGYVGSSTRSSVLSNGPGAPQPLTAGPPGQRQYKASTLEAPIRAIRGNSLKSSSPGIDEAHFELNTTTLFNLGTPSLAKTQESTATQNQHGSNTEKVQQLPKPNLDAFGKSYPWNTFGKTGPSRPCHHSIRDTKTLDQIKEYYPNGGPPGLCDPANIVSVPDDHSDLLRQAWLPVDRMDPSFPARAQRDAQHRARFYAGVPELTKTWDERLETMRKKLEYWQSGLGPAQKTSPILNLIEISKPRDVPIERVTALKTHEAAEPLLGMAFSTLSNYWENGILMDVPTGFKKLEKQINDEKDLVRPTCMNEDITMTKDMWAFTNEEQCQNTWTLPSKNNKSRWGFPQTPCK